MSTFRGELQSAAQIIQGEGKSVFILVVDLCEYEKPISQRSYKPIRITADELKKADLASRVV